MTDTAERRAPRADRPRAVRRAPTDPGSLGPAASGRLRTRRPVPITAGGVGVIVLAVVLYAAGVLLGYDVLLAAAAGLVAMTVLASLWVLVRPSVTVSRSVEPDRVEAGNPVLGRLTVRNRSRLPSVSFAAVDRVGPHEVEVRVPLLAGGGRRSVLYAVPAQKRGRFVVGPLTVERRDPLGLFRRAERVEDDELLWVHPRVHAATALPVGIVPDYEGRSSANPQRGTVTFSSLREYVAGDDPRQIHWRSSARRGELMVREHIDTTEPTTTIVLDTDTEVLTETDFDHACEVAASLLWPVLAVGRPVELRVVAEDPSLVTDVPDPGSTATGTAAGHIAGTIAMDRLAAATRARHRDDQLVATVDALPAGGSLVVITGDVPETVTARLAEQRRRFNPVVVLRVAAAATEAATRRRPGLAVITAPDAAEGVRRWNRMAAGDIDTADPGDIDTADPGDIDTGDEGRP